MNAVIAPHGETQWIDCTNPATGESLGRIAAATPDQVDAAVARASEAQRSWGARSLRQRRAVLQRLLDEILAHCDEIVDTVVTDSGKTHENALLGEIMTVCNKLRWTIRNGERHLRPERVPAGILLHKRARIEYRPLGVVGCIVPWNYPFQNIFGSLIAPLMAGNAVIIKASEQVAWSSARFQELLDRVFIAAGVDPATVQIIHGYGDTGAALVRAGVQKILFIGSVPNGRRIVAGSAETLTPVIMELGGKDPLIVCDDADLDAAVHAALGGCFINLGQNCVSSERIIVQDGLYERFVAAVAERAGAFRQGVPSAPGRVDAGAVTSPLQMAVIDELVSDALAQGATALVGGRRPDRGQFYPPTVLTGVTPQMRIAREEVFGPVMTILRVADDAEAIALANATAFGLQSSVFSCDQARARRIADALQAGGSCINDFGLLYMNQDLPFGGVKQSGFGRMNGRDGLRAYTNAKAVMENRYGFSVPARLYPVGPGDYARARAALHLLYGRGWRQRLRALADIWRARRAGDNP